MVDTVVAYILLGACVLGCLWWTNVRKASPKGPHPETLGADGKPDPFLAAISAERAAIEQREFQETRRRYDEITATAGDLEEAKARSRLKEFAKKNGLDRDLIELRWAIESYPRYAEGEGWPAQNELGVDNPLMVDVPNGWGVQFGFEGTTYVVQVTQAENTLITVTFVENGEEMFAVERFNHFDSTGDVVAFKRRGNWAKTLMTLIARQRAASAQRDVQWWAKEVEKGKGRFEE